MELCDIVTSEFNPVTYKYGKLPNGLNVVFAHDPHSTSSTANLLVGVGGNLCGETYGLAHFLEHMLFIGSVKYPKPGDYTKFLKHHSGSYNATTYPNQTEYFFSISTDVFEHALDMFSRFFIDPLFSQESIEKEMDAVDSEYANNVTVDFKRKWQVLDTYINKQCNFTCGNKQTLNIENIRQKLIDFYKQYYSANNMYLCICSNLSFEEQMKLVETKFSEIPNNNTIIEPNTSPLYHPDIFGKCIQLHTVSKINNLTISWTYPSQKRDITESVENFLAHLLGHEGTGSIFDTLKKMGYISSLSTMIQNKTKIESIFSIIVSLTDSGVVHHQVVFEVIYQYLDMLNSYNVGENFKILYDEYNEISRINWKYARKNTQLDIASNVTNKMFEYRDIVDFQYILALTTMTTEFTEAIQNKIAFILSYFTPENGFIVFQSKNHTDKPTHKEKWYGADYSICPYVSYVTDKTYDLRLPTLNIFIPNSFDVYVGESMSAASKIYENGTTQVFYRFINKYGLPKAIVSININLNHMRSIRQVNLGELFCRMLSIVLNETLYDATLIHNKYSIVFDENCVKICMNGYTDKLDQISKIIIDTIINIRSFFNQSIFDQALEKYSQNLENYKFKKGYETIGYVLKTKINSTAYLPESMIADLLSIKFGDIFDVFDEVNLIGYACGNITLDETNAILDPFIQYFGKFKPNTVLCDYTQYIDVTKSTQYDMTCYNEKDKNSCTLVSYMCGYNSVTSHTFYKTHAILQLVQRLISPVVFTTLRSDEKYGYVVACILKNYGYSYNQVNAITFIIQSNTKTTTDMTDRIKLFVEKFYHSINDLNDETIDGIKKTMITKLSEKCNNIYEEYTHDIDSLFITNFQHLDFNLKLVEEIEKVTKQDIIDFYTEYLITNPILNILNYCPITKT